MKSLLSFIMLLVCSVMAGQSLPFAKLHTYNTGIFDSSAVYNFAYDRSSKYLYVANKARTAVDVYSYTNFSKPGKIATIDVSTYVGSVNSVAVHFGLLAVVGSGSNPQSSGKLLLYDQNYTFRGQFSVGANPDMITYTPGGNKVIIASEGNPSDDYSADPWGSVSILDVSAGPGFISQSDVKTVYFDRYDTIAYDPLVNIYGNLGAQSFSQDAEPEHIAVNSSATKAYITLQENNALAILDINTATLDTVVGLGYKYFGGAVGLDASDMAQNINIRSYLKLFAQYQPDGIATYETNGNTYLLSANEGEFRDFTAYSEVIRAKNLPINISNYPNWNSVTSDTLLGRLKLTTSLGHSPGSFIYDSLFCSGGRSFSIWDDNGQLLWDSGDEFEETLKALHAAEFNSDFDDNNSRKSRSDEHGPEPNCITIGEVEGKTYAFIGLERMGGIMVYDITDPLNPQFILYQLNRNFSAPANSAAARDLGPEQLLFVPSNDNSRKMPLLFVANKVSGTITVYEMGTGVGLEEGYALDDLSFYPNPSEGNFKTQRYDDYSIYGANGQLIMKVTNQNQLNLHDQPSGYYIIRNSDGSSVRVIKK